MYNNYYNPNQYMNTYQQRLENMQQPKYEIIHINGENGARAFRMQPNSQCLLLDDTAPLIWLCQSDGAGYHTVTPYKIEPYQPQQEPNYAQLFNNLDERLKRLEEMTNEKSNVTTNAGVQQATTNEQQSNAITSAIQQI